ncbi:hypothetical protein A2348_02370 [Candidatus Uhrbacteria bacterium RIFOXYB12_FULL_58_10]|nr:MAG: hypothetical protein A2348_02370 [Candidatus Uhrbacteria bacterium RIFOXYB12_FULL_58_10]
MSQEEGIKAMAEALLSGSGFMPEKAVGMAGVTFFGTSGDVSLWAQFVIALNAASGNEDPKRTARVTRIVRRTDELAEKDSGLVIGRLKNEIKDLTDAEILFLVSYLAVGHKINATPTEDAPAEIQAPPITSIPSRMVLTNTGAHPQGTLGTDAARANARQHQQAPPAQQSPPAQAPVARALFDGSAWAGGAAAGGASPPVASPEQSSADEPMDPRVAPASTGPVREVRELDDEPTDLDAHGGHGALPPQDWGRLIKIAAVAICFVILVCTGSLSFLNWLFN